MNNLIKSVRFNLIIILFTLFLSCNNNSNSNNKTNNHVTQENIKNTSHKNIKLDIKIQGENKTEFIIGKKFTFLIEQKDTTQFDSVQFFINNQFLKTSTIIPTKITWNSNNAKTGKNSFEARVFSQENMENWKLSLTLLSDIKPEEYSFKIINTFPHDRAAYTQGLVYEDGFLYEATGVKGESTLRKVQLATGEILQAVTLPKDIFGEGITLFGDKIIQLSYQAYTGFVFDKKSFKLLVKFNYPKPTEGWGLTNDGKNLIMSDGTHNLYYIDPVSFSQTGKLEVYDQKGPVNRLNELDIINGELWANIYTTDKIAKIDLKTGKVIAYIDLTEILPQKDYERDTDVLNGIAYDEENDRIFVTGKRWPKLFEIQLK